MDGALTPMMFIALKVAPLERLLEQMLLLTALCTDNYHGGIKLGGLGLGGEIEIFLPVQKTLLG